MTIHGNLWKDQGEWADYARKLWGANGGWAGYQEREVERNGKRTMRRTYLVGIMRDTPKGVERLALGRSVNGYGEAFERALARIAASEAQRQRAIERDAKQPEPWARGWPQEKMPI
jgi:hypothetical protein